jgi:hypothetical protein
MRQGHFILWLVSLTIVFFVAYEVFGSEEHTDFKIYKAAGAVVGSSTSIYDVVLPCRRCGPTGLTYGYLYPPLLAVMFKVYANFSPVPMELLWPLVNVVAIFVVASCFYLLKVCKVEKIPLCGIYLVLWMPTMDGLIMGQVHLFVLALLAVFLVACERGAGMTAGASLALAIHLKITPVLLVPVLLTTKGRSARAPFVLAMLSLILFSTLFDGPSIFMRFLESSSTLGYGDHYWKHTTNMTPAKVFSCSLLGLNPAVAVKLHRVLVIGALAYSVVRVLRSPSIDTTLLGSRLIVVMVLASPIIWYHHLVWFAIPLVVALKITGFRRKIVVAALVGGITSSLYLQFYMSGLHGPRSESIIGPLMLILVGVVLLTLLKEGPATRRVERWTRAESQKTLVDSAVFEGAPLCLVVLLAESVTSQGDRVDMSKYPGLSFKHSLIQLY